jgi:hypothetical protein
LTKTTASIITAAVEGLVDEAVVRRLVLVECKGKLGNIHGKNGKPDLQRKINAYNSAAQRARWLVLVDLNNEADCVPPMKTRWVPIPSWGMCFRVAVRAVEAWLLADRETISRFLSIPLSLVPGNPEVVENPKQVMVNLARRSRRRDIREDMVPRPEGGRSVGPAYSSRMVEYVSSTWQPDVAAQSSESLRRCLVRLKEVIRL